MSTRRLTLAAMGLLCALGGLFAFSGASASADVIHPYLCQITASSIPSATECNGVGNTVPGGPFGAPQGVAVDSTGHVYVSDGANRVVDVFDSSGSFTGQITGTAPGAPFTNPWGVAVDGSNDVWVADVGPGHMDKFDSSGKPLAQGTGEGHWSGAYTQGVTFSDASDRLYVADSNNDDLWVLNSDGTFNSDITGPWGTGCCYIYAAADNSGGPGGGDVYVSSDKNGVSRIDGAGSPATFSGSASYISGAQLTGTPGGSFGRLAGVAVDSAGNVYVLDQGRGVVDEFDSTGTFVGQTSGGGTPSGSFTSPQGVAVNAAGDVYVADQGSPAVVDVFGPSIVLPDVTTGPVSNPRARSATLTGTVNPDKAGAATCRFVWGTTTAYGHTAACSTPVAEGESPVPVQAQLSGLEPNTTYHYRLQATNTNGTNPGEPAQDREFTTPLGLHGESVSNVTATSATLNAAIDPHNAPATYYFQYGTSMAYGTSVPAPPGAALGSGEGDVEVGQHLQGLLAGTVYHYRVVALSELAPGVFESFDGPDQIFTTQRSGAFALPDGREWELVSPPDKHGAGILPIFALALGTQAAAAGDAMAYVTTAPTEGEPAGNSNFTQVLSTRGGVGAWGSRDLSIPHSQGTGFSDTVEEYPGVFSSDLSLSVVQPFGPFDPLLSGEASEQTGYVRSDYLHGEPGDLCAASCYRPLVTGAPGFANVPPGTEFGVNTNLGVKCPPEPVCGPQILAATPDLSHVVLYSGGAVLTPGGGAFYEWSGGQLQPVPGVGQGLSSFGSIVEPTVVRNAISADGSRVYFSGGVREDIGTSQARTVPVPGGAFQTASVDGSRAFVLGGGELSEFDLETEASTPLAAGVLGVIGASEDGSSIYFVSNAVLTGEEENGQDQKAGAGQPNLYVSHAGSTTFIATLSGEDSPDWKYSEGSGLQMTTRVSPDGRWIAFMSQRSLTGYDNRDAVSGAPDEEVYLYHAAGGGNGGKLVCASCDPTGARPHGLEYRHLDFPPGLVGGFVWNDSRWMAANVPAWTSAYHQSRYLSDSGRLFFDSSDALVPQDTNGTEDVYEYEPPGVGGCTDEGSSFGRASGGCVGLISSGTSPDESAFLDASESGGDVFFLTAAKLSSVDVDAAVDVYDAHECSASSPCPPPPPPPAPACEGDACQSPVAAPEDPTPGSLTYRGPGNSASPASTTPAVKPKSKPVKCRKGSVRKHSKCVKAKAGKRAKARKVSNKRRARP